MPDSDGSRNLPEQEGGKELKVESVDVNILSGSIRDENMKKDNTAAKVKKVETKIKNPKRVNLRRKQIIEGAIKVFIEKGFHNATTREIAEASGITEGTLYNYVRSKEDIVYIVYDYITRILRKEFNDAVEDIDDPKERLVAALRQNLTSIHDYQDIVMFIYKASTHLDRESLHEVLARETEYIESFEDLLRSYFQGRAISEDKIKLAADLLTYIPVIVTFRRWSLRRRFDSMEKVMQDILEFVLHGIEFIPANEPLDAKAPRKEN
jgi:AcrR family transcriptional regulator